MAVLLAAFAAVAAAPTTRWLTLNNGVKMPQMCLGTWKYDNATAEDAVGKAYQAGFRHFMTAFDYGNQVGFGKGVKKLLDSGVKRDEIFVASMVPPCTLRKLTAEACYNWTRDHIETDMSLIGLKQLDIVIIHAPDTGPVAGCDAQACVTDAADVQALADAHTAGKIRSFGVSNYCPKCIDCLLEKGLKPQLNQVQYHVGMGDDPIGLVSYQRKHKILLQAYSALATGKLVTDPLLERIGASHNKTAAQVALKWIVDKEMGVATKADNVQYLAEDADMYSWKLTAAEAAEASAEPCNASWGTPMCNPSYACGYTFAPYVAESS
eukprot:TRINITY_DN42980_c0_g1_i1.p1 TRINITY_DN42980_c0_g1~~TRINITY_DN42980_c0_g1_i1.p1  ORF type:complete len:341 (+),score=136.42 TRINITY_DN42980_c0_g1_i1:56-1024(+)